MNCFVIVDNLVVVSFWEGSKESNDVITILFELTGSMREDKKESFGVLGEDNFPVTQVANFFSSNRWPEFELNFTNLLCLPFIKGGGMHRGENMVETRWLSSDNVVPVFRREDGTIRLGLNGRAGILWFMGEIRENNMGFFERLREVDL